MYTRSNSATLTVHERFASCATTRSTQPEVFTFEQVPTQATAVRSYVPIRPKRRCTRVMYPAKVRMHLPPPEKGSQAKRWLVVLCLVVLWQIYTEEPCAAAAADASPSAAEYQGFSFQSAEEQVSAAPTATGTGTGPGEDQTSSTSGCRRPGQETDSSRPLEQGAGNSYVVALLVYHRLGSEK
ncbi:radiation-inducible immediate-early gene IEX-1 [Scophthalmus maximus]|uniref:radiation-inducible immediate-early gene IEX-1 n=1 Tax=Scophthalmus maximus TaxID=52904 RepID=UPI001FA92E6D|nr:radiation-inducible immediate-early gene IEX-1 [Scophthalmus maximus]